MARSARRVPTVQELDERLTNVERELAQVVSTVTRVNQAAISEAKWFRDTFMEHRDEVRKGFAETAKAAEVGAVKSDLAAVKTEVAAIRSDLTDLSDRLTKGFANVLDEIRKRRPE